MVHKQTSVAVVCPVYDCPVPAFHESTLALMVHRTGHKFVYHPEYQGADLHRGRNSLAAWFLKMTDCGWMLMTDSDMQFSPEDICRLLSRNKRVIGGLYKKRNGSGHYVLNTLDGMAFNPTVAEVQRVKYIGTGFLLIHRSVLDEMIAHFKDDPGFEYDADQGERFRPADGRTDDGVRWDFFFNGIRDRRLLSVDWGFCQRWADLGGEVFVDCKKLTHYGRAGF